MDWTDAANKALERDEEWIQAMMGPMASIVRKYYVRGYLKGVEDARETPRDIRIPKTKACTGRTEKKGAGWCACHT